MIFTHTSLLHGQSRVHGRCQRQRPHKVKSIDRIALAVASIMAVGRAAANASMSASMSASMMG